MDYNNEISAMVTTISINPDLLDRDKIQKENEQLMELLRNMEFDGVKQDLLTDELNVIATTL